MSLRCAQQPSNMGAVFRKEINLHVSNLPNTSCSMRRKEGQFGFGILRLVGAFPCREIGRGAITSKNVSPQDNSASGSRRATIAQRPRLCFLQTTKRCCHSQLWSSCYRLDPQKALRRRVGLQSGVLLEPLDWAGKSHVTGGMPVKKTLPTMPTSSKPHSSLAAM